MTPYIIIISPLLITFVLLLQATPRLSEDKVKQCIDPKLNNDFPPKAVAKVRSSFSSSNIKRYLHLLCLVKDILILDASRYHILKTRDI